MGFFILEPNQYNLLNIFCKFHHHKLELSPDRLPSTPLLKEDQTVFDGGGGDDEGGDDEGTGDGGDVIISNCCPIGDRWARGPPPQPDVYLGVVRNMSQHF